MKNKKLIRTFAVLLAALVIMGGFSVTAYAGGGDYYDELNNEPIPEETTEPQPLTPEGNMSLVDDIEGDAAEDKQFIVVQSKGGNYFYIIIDNAAKGENTVHFLNQVDEADLLALIDDEDKLSQQPEVTPQPTPEPIPQPEPEQPKEEKSNTGGMLLTVLLLAGIGGGALYYFKILKPKQTVKGDTDLDEFDFDEYDEEAEDEQPEADNPEEQEDEE